VVACASLILFVLLCERECAHGVCKRSTRCRGALFRVNIYRENTMHIKVLRGFVHLEGFCGSNSTAATQSAERCCSYVTRPHHFQRRALVRWDRDFPREPKPILWTSLYDDAAQFLIESPRSCTVKFFVEAGAHFFPAHHTRSCRENGWEKALAVLSARSHKIFRLTKPEPPFVLMSELFLSLGCVLYIWRGLHSSF
jgi:hypothetical protein